MKLYPVETLLQSLAILRQTRVLPTVEFDLDGLLLDGQIRLGLYYVAREVLDDPLRYVV